MKYMLVILMLYSGSTTLAAINNIKLEKPNNDIYDKRSLQNGAKLFMNYCSGCHSIKYMRYNRMAKDLGLTDADVMANLMFNGEKPGDLIINNIAKNDAEKWFGALPPDLSLTARSRGTDWIYTYLRSFYQDDTRLFNVDNTVLAGTSMPDVLWSLRKNNSAAEFKKNVRDIVNFLDYVAEPVKLVRQSIGLWVLGFLIILLILTYLLKKEYWLDVKYGKWKTKP